MVTRKTQAGGEGLQVGGNRILVETGEKTWFLDSAWETLRLRGVLADFYLDASLDHLGRGRRDAPGCFFADVILAAVRAHQGGHTAHHQYRALPFDRDGRGAGLGLGLATGGALHGCLVRKSDCQSSGSGWYTVITTVMSLSGSSAATTWMGRSPAQPSRSRLGNGVSVG